MKKTKQFISFLLAIVMMISMSTISVDAKTIKSSNVSGAKKQVKTMVKLLTPTSGAYLNHHMKYKQKKTVKFSKKANRNNFIECVTINKNKQGDIYNSDVLGKWFFGKAADKNLYEKGAEYNSCEYTKKIKNLKISHKGKYYTAKYKVIYHIYRDVYNKSTKEYDTVEKDVTIGTCSLKFKLKANTHYGLILTEGTFQRTYK